MKKTIIPLLTIACLFLAAAASFFLPVLKVGNPATGEAMIWNGEVLYSLNGWQACKLLFLIARNDNVFFTFMIVSAFGAVAILANPAFWLGLFLLGIRRWWGTTVAGLLATTLAAVPLWCVPDKLLTGYYLWISSMVVLTVAGLIGASKGAAAPRRRSGA
jgi:hypothetical protein